MTRNFNDIAIVGAGAWGTALAHCLSSADRQVTLWGRASVAFERLSVSRYHPALPGAKLPVSVDCTSMLETVAICDAVIIATPAQTQRNLARALHGIVGKQVPVMTAAKGVEIGTGLLMPDVIKTVLPDNPVGVLSGPTFAAELAKGLPAAITLAMPETQFAEQLGHAFVGSSLRVYASDDVTGVALGGAFKNVLAIAAGAVAGAKLGANARAAIISRGLAELTRLGRAVGARAETLSGLSGLGDIVLSCTDAQSRNYSYGHALGRGDSPPETLAEGALAVAPLLSLAERHNIELPIASAVDGVVNHGVPFSDAVAALVTRPERRE